MAIGHFNYAEQISYNKILAGRLWEEKSAGRRQIALQYFWSLKTSTRTFNIHSIAHPPNFM